LKVHLSSYLKWIKDLELSLKDARLNGVIRGQTQKRLAKSASSMESKPISKKTGEITGN